MILFHVLPNVRTVLNKKCYNTTPVIKTRVNFSVTFESFCTTKRIPNNKSALIYN